MLKQSASRSCSFGLFGLSGLFGCMRLTRWTRQTGLAPHVRTIEVLACHSSFSEYLILAGSCAFRIGKSLSSGCKDMVKHRPGQYSGKGILLARMV
jgi:hypothetical protein